MGQIPVGQRILSGFPKSQFFIAGFMSNIEILVIGMLWDRKIQQEMLSSHGDPRFSQVFLSGYRPKCLIYFTHAYCPDTRTEP